MRVVGGNDKLNLDLVRSVKINCTCTGNSFEGTCFVVCRFRRDCVSISFGMFKPRSCVDFAEIVCRFRQVFIEVRLRFEKSSPRWRIIGREEIKEIQEDSTETESQKERERY